MFLTIYEMGFHKRTKPGRGSAKPNEPGGKRSAAGAEWRRLILYHSHLFLLERFLSKPLFGFFFMPFSARFIQACQRNRQDIGRWSSLPARNTIFRAAMLNHANNFLTAAMAVLTGSIRTALKWLA